MELASCSLVWAPPAVGSGVSVEEILSDGSLGSGVESEEIAVVLEMSLGVSP